MSRDDDPPDQLEYRSRDSFAVGLLAAGVAILILGGVAAFFWWNQRERRADELVAVRHAEAEEAEAAARRQQAEAIAAKLMKGKPVDEAGNHVDQASAILLPAAAVGGGAWVALYEPLRK